jgi:hypothetical protein
VLPLLSTELICVGVNFMLSAFKAKNEFSAASDNSFLI